MEVHVARKSGGRIASPQAECIVHDNSKEIEHISTAIVPKGACDLWKELPW